MSLANVKALLFDTFGTVVDWGELDHFPVGRPLIGIHARVVQTHGLPSFGRGLIQWT